LFLAQPFSTNVPAKPDFRREPQLPGSVRKLQVTGLHPMSEFETLAVRAGIQRSQFNDHSEGLFLTSSFVF